MKARFKLIYLSIIKNKEYYTLHQTRHESIHSSRANAYKEYRKVVADNAKRGNSIKIEFVGIEQL